MGFHLGTDKTALEVLLKGVGGDSLEPGGLAECLVPTPLLTSAQILPASQGPGVSLPWEAFLTMQACRVPHCRVLLQILGTQPCFPNRPRSS